MHMIPTFRLQFNSQRQLFQENQDSCNSIACRVALTDGREFQGRRWEIQTWGNTYFSVHGLFAKKLSQVEQQNDSCHRSDTCHVEMMVLSDSIAG